MNPGGRPNIRKIRQPHILPSIVNSKSSARSGGYRSSTLSTPQRNTTRTTGTRSPARRDGDNPRPKTVGRALHPKARPISVSVRTNRLNSSHGRSLASASSHEEPRTPILLERRRNICAERYTSSSSKTPAHKSVPKSKETRSNILSAFAGHFLFSSLRLEVQNAAIDAMVPRQLAVGEILMREGDPGDNFYILDEGNLDIEQNTPKGRVVVRRVVPGEKGYFGDLALLYNSPRSATISATTPSKVWALDRATFRKILAHVSGEMISGVKETLARVPLLEGLTKPQLNQLVDATRWEEVPAGTVIYEPGVARTALHIITEGEVKRTHCSHDRSSLCLAVPRKKSIQAEVLRQGSWFGEQALLGSQEVPPPSVRIEAVSDIRCLCLDKKALEHLLGPLKEVIDANVRLQALRRVKLLSALTNREMDKILSAMHVVRFEPAHQIITQGDVGREFYVIRDGSVVVSQQTENPQMTGDDSEKPTTEKTIVTYNSGDYFGEMALLTDTPRNANVVAGVDGCTCFVLGRAVFTRVLGSLRQYLNRQMVIRILRAVDILNSLTETELERAAQEFRIREYRDREHIIMQNDIGNEFFIIKEGEVKITSSATGKKHIEIGRRHAGDYFGEMALLTKQKRMANIIAVGHVECFVLNRRAFIKLLGSSQATMLRHLGERRAAFQKAHEAAEKTLVKSVRIEDLEALDTLGIGTYGKVQKVRHRDTGALFALKSLHKTTLIELGQEFNVVSEKSIMQKLDHPNILRLVATYNDPNRLYMLLELVRGGELYVMMKRRSRQGKKLRPSQAKFYAACVVLALEHMHDRQIIHRDLKTENLLIDSEGYIKLVDFGFAKQLEDNRTYTFCGTPEYMSPEMVKGEGHGKAVDWWAFGVMLFEMICNVTPSQYPTPAPSTHETMQRILEHPLQFPREVDDFALKDLIKRLLTHSPSNRLGCIRGGVHAIKEHPWFAGFNWSALYHRKLKAPWVPAFKSSGQTTNFSPPPERPDPAPYNGQPAPWDGEF